MKKIFILSLSLILLLQMTTACQNTKDQAETTINQTETDESSHNDGTSPNIDVAKKAIPLKDYDVLLFQNSVGGQNDTTTPKYNGVSYYKEERFEKSDVAPKHTFMGDEDITLYYSNSIKPNHMYNNERDSYSYLGYNNDGELKEAFADYNSNTDKLIRFKKSIVYKNDEYSPGLSSQSTQEEYIAYIKNLLLDISDVSVDGIEAEIFTVIMKKDSSTIECVPYFVNNSDTDPDFYATYKFDFNRNIDGIDRVDNISITISNFGELYKLSAIDNSERYKPFENVKINRELIDSKLEDILSKLRIQYNIQSYDISLSGYPIDSSLYVEAAVSFTFLGSEDITLSAGRKYLIKVAEIQ